MNIKVCSSPSKYVTKTWCKNLITKQKINLNQIKEIEGLKGEEIKNKRIKSQQASLSPSFSMIPKISNNRNARIEKKIIQSTIDELRFNSISSRPNISAFHSNNHHTISSIFSHRKPLNIKQENIKGIKTSYRLENRPKRMRMSKSDENSQILMRWI